MSYLLIQFPFFSCFQGYDKDDLEWMPQQSKKINTSSQPQSYQTNLSENYDGEDKSNVHKKIEIINNSDDWTPIDVGAVTANKNIYNGVSSGIAGLDFTFLKSNNENMYLIMKELLDIRDEVRGN